MQNTDSIVSCLELVGDTYGDPVERVYDRLFSARPDLKALFVLDTDGGVKGSMLQQGLECILDYAGEGSVAPQVIATTRAHHSEYGVPEEAFDEFFIAIRDTFRDILDVRWTSDMEHAWDRLITDFARM